MLSKAIPKTMYAVIKSVFIVLSMCYLGKDVIDLTGEHGPYCHSERIATGSTL